MLVTSALVAATNIPEAVYLTVACSRQSEPPPSNNHTHCCHLHCPSPGLQAPPCVCPPSACEWVTCPTAAQSKEWPGLISV